MSKVWWGNQGSEKKKKSLDELDKALQTETSHGVVLVSETANSI